MLVLRTAGNVKNTKLVRPLVRHYKAQLKNSSFRFALLHDMTTGPDEQKLREVLPGLTTGTGSGAVAEQLGFRVDLIDTVLDRIDGRTASIAKGFLYTGDADEEPPPPQYQLARQHGREQAGEEQQQQALGVPLCVVSWSEAADEAPEHTFEQPGFKLKGAHMVHDQNLVLWHRHCGLEGQDDGLLAGANESQGQKVWFAEADAYYNGDVKRFLDHFSGHTADLIASGFRIAGPNWHKWRRGMFAAAFANGMPEVTADSKAVAHVAVIPPMRESPKDCQEKGVDKRGLLFFQDHVVRVSERLLQAVSDNMAKGIIGASEAYMSTMCASSFGIQDCTIEDFSPVRGNRAWTSNNYWWWCTSYESKKRSHCKEKGLQNKWIHKFKVANGSVPLACPSG